MMTLPLSDEPELNHVILESCTKFKVLAQSNTGSVTETTRATIFGSFQGALYFQNMRKGISL